MHSRNSQRGWVALIGILLALVIIGLLSQTLLKRMGLFSEDRVTTKTAGPRGPGPTGAVPIDPTGAAPVPGNAVERARGLESSLQQQTQDMGQRIDSQTK
jgi:hypothetical protein